MVLRLLTLLALVLMPFGMATAGAMPAHHAPAAATAEHCDGHDGQPAEQTRDQSMDCAISCSMLAIAQVDVEGPSAARPVPTARPLVQPHAGVPPDTATPPPKLS
jgi:hypothetical protein